MYENIKQRSSYEHFYQKLSRPLEKGKRPPRELRPQVETHWCKQMLHSLYNDIPLKPSAVGHAATKKVTWGQRWAEPLFQTPTPLPFQNFWNRIRVRNFFKLENPTPVLTPATIDPTEIYLCFYLRNDHADSCYCRIWKVIPSPNEKSRILPESTPDPWSSLVGATGRLVNMIS